MKTIDKKSVKNFRRQIEDILIGIHDFLDDDELTTEESESDNGELVMSVRASLHRALDTIKEIE